MDKVGNSELEPHSSYPDMAVFDYRPESLLKTTDAYGLPEPPLPELTLMQQAASICSYVNGVGKDSCPASFPLYETAIGFVPSSKEQLDAKWADRQTTEQKSYAQKPISNQELVGYMQKYDHIRGATDYRFIYGVTLNNYGFEHGDEAAKEKAKEVLTDAAAMSNPQEYSVRGALMEANRGEKIDYTKTYSEGAVQYAEDLLGITHASKVEAPKEENLSSKIVSSITGLVCDFTSCKTGPSQTQINHATEALNWAAVEAPEASDQIMAREIALLSPEQGKLLQDIYRRFRPDYK